jgi:hypothetical protein
MPQSPPNSNKHRDMFQTLKSTSQQFAMFGQFYNLFFVVENDRSFIG